MEKLQIKCTRGLLYGDDFLCIKLFIIGLRNALLQFLPGKIRKIQLHHLVGCLLVGHLRKLFKGFIQNRYPLRHKQAALFRKPFKDCF